MKKKPQKQRSKASPQRWIFIGGLLAGLALVAGIWWVTLGRAEEPEEAPEAQKVLDVQANMPFQVLIPAYLPRGFDRANMEIDVSQIGPGGEPMAKLTYRMKNGKTLFIQEWVPVNPDMETLAASRPVETKWGRGWLLRQGDSLAALWVDVGPLRASIYSRDVDALPAEQLLAIADTMGPASNRQVFSFIVEPPEIRAVPPAPPVEATVKDGVQEVDLIITPGGYSPLRFSVKKGMPVRLTFRALGEVGCGNELNLPISSNQAEALLLDGPTDEKELVFTPEEAGQFQFFCGHAMYRGVMLVHD
jgi:hypothetical protein